MKTGRLHVLTAGLAAVCAALHAEPSRPIRFDRLSLEQGLSQSAVNRILQDSRGYVWLATEDGLNRYDGVAVRVYRHDAADPSSLPAGFVWDLAEDADGNLWVATGDGLVRWLRATDRFVSYAPLAGRNTRALHVSALDGSLWIGTRDAGVYHLRPPTGETTHFAHDPARRESLVDDRVYALLVDRAGRLWVGTDDGLDRLDPGTDAFVHFAADGSPSSLSDGRVRSILEDDAGVLWVGTFGGGLNRLGADGRFDHFRHAGEVRSSLAHDRIRALLQDGEGRLWVGTADGLDLFDRRRGAFVHYRSNPLDSTSLADGHVLSLAQDRGGVLWVGTRQGGAHRWNPLSWQFGHVAAQPDDPEGLGSPRVTAFSMDASGRLWIGTYDAGLHVEDRASGDMTRHRHDPRNPRSLASDRVSALLHDRKGRLWVGTLDAGVDRFVPESGTFVHHRSDPLRPDSLSADGITTIFEDRRGQLWMGTYGSGLNRFDPETGRVQRFRHDASDEQSLNDDRIACVADAPGGRLWVATMEKGIALFDPQTGRFERFQHRRGDRDSLGSDSVYTLYQDPVGVLWVGTHGGLSRLDPGSRRFRTYTVRDGMPNDVVYAVRSDRQGRLWLSTNNGVACLDPRSGGFRNYGVSDGLQATEFNFGAWYQSPGGELFFGGVNGFNAFFPDRLRDVTQPPAVVLTAVTVGRRPVEGPPDQVREVRLGFRDRVLELDFAALDFTAPQRNSFLYRLDGFDPDWVPSGPRRSVTYTNLSPGRYTFRLRGANSSGRWSEKPVAVAIRVDAAPWATPLAVGLYALVLAFGVAVVLRAQRRRLQREEEHARLLEERVQARTRELSERQLELERANRELAQASITDSLTGLANRRFLTEYLEREVALLHRRYRRQSEGLAAGELFDLSFLMIDVDSFKGVNDSSGHAAGDAVLRQFRDLLTGVSRSSDIIVRWGGDEFLLVARDQTAEGLAELAERIRCTVEQYVFEIGEGRRLHVTCSIGLASYPFFREQLDALTWEQVVSVADRALYVAKASGRNGWVGFRAGLAALPIHGLFGEICRSIHDLVCSGTLRVVSSFGPRPLVLDLPRTATRAAGRHP